jgi:hypothetical protein
VFELPRQLLASVWQWAGGDNDPDAEPAWDFGRGRVDVLFSAGFFGWWSWRNYGIFPRSGGWHEQPLAALVRNEAMDMVYSTRRFMMQKDSDWSKLTATQRALADWLGENGE